MQKIATAKGTKDLLEKYSFSFRKKFGQNFLINPLVLDEIIDSANITKEDCIVEIGPGIGSVTQALLESAGKVIAIEIDNHLIPILEEQFGHHEHFKLVHQDVLKVDLNALLAQEAEGKNVKVVANLPYYITTPILMALLENELPIESITVMVQKEVADRLASKPGSKQYGAITVSMNYYCQVSLVTDVPSNCFMPAPNVDSAVIRLDLHKNPPVNVKDTPQLFKIIRAAFSQRRKTLLNTLHANGDLDLSKETIKEILEATGIGANTRGETLSLEDFAMLSDKITENKIFDKK
jgi:16S rRNA (adenine1518-N6/adenine1519-N6)-dimethyltransferase